MARFIGLIALCAIAATNAADIDSHGGRVLRASKTDEHQEIAATALAYCTQCQATVKAFQAMSSAQRGAALVSSDQLKKTLNTTMSPNAACAGSLATQCNSAIAQLSGGYFGVLTKYAMSCTTTDGVAKKAVMPCPPVSICAGVAPLTTTSVCDPDPTRRLVA